MNAPSRSGAPPYSRRSHAIEPSAASARSSSMASGATSRTVASQASRPSTFSRPISPPPTTRQRRPGELQAGDVERGVEHPLHAGLVADPLAELADAVLSGVGLSGHEPARVVPRTALLTSTVPPRWTPTSPTPRCCAACTASSAVAFSGPRALLMQATHPVAFEGFFAHTGAFDAPYERLRRTAQVMDTIAFGSRADADRATRRVRAMHARVRGELAAAGRALPRRHAVRRRRSRAAAVGARVARRLGARRLRPLRRLAVARRARRVLAGLPRRRRAVRAGRRRDAAPTSTPSTTTCAACSTATTCS